MGKVVREFLARSKRKGYKKLLTGKDTVPTAEEYENVVAKSNKSGNGILVRLNDMNNQAFEVMTKQGKVKVKLPEQGERRPPRHHRKGSAVAADIASLEQEERHPRCLRCHHATRARGPLSVPSPAPLRHRNKGSAVHADVASPERWECRPRCPCHCCTTRVREALSVLFLPSSRHQSKRSAVCAASPPPPPPPPCPLFPLLLHAAHLGSTHHL